MHIAKIIGITKPLELDLSSAEDLVAYTARVSNPSNQHNTSTAPKLLKYLAKNKHWSPFEMVSVVMEINTTRDIARQILRHRSFSFQEFSQRYAVVDELGFEFKEARLQDNKNRQNSIETSDTELQDLWRELQQDVVRKAKQTYQWAISNGIAKEQARAILPEGLTMSRLYMSGTLRSWIHYCELRCEAGTQKEHRQVAFSCRDQLTEHFPSLKEFFIGEHIEQ
jgi:thymidylate synthase (FAD)